MDFPIRQVLYENFEWSRGDDEWLPVEQQPLSGLPMACINHLAGVEKTTRSETNNLFLDILNLDSEARPEIR